MCTFNLKLILSFWGFNEFCQNVNFECLQKQLVINSCSGYFKKHRELFNFNSPEMYQLDMFCKKKLSSSLKIEIITAPYVRHTK